MSRGFKSVPKPKYSFSKRSLKRLEAAHPDLQKVFNLAIQRTHIDFTVLEVARTLAKQKKYYQTGATRTMNSRHLLVTPKGGGDPVAHAVDIAPYINGRVSWAWPLYYELEKVIKECAKELGVPIEWGGDWQTFKDGPHWQLPWGQYPKGP